MSARTEAIAELVDQHDSVLEAWSTRRCQEERDLDLHKVKATERGYILWFAALSEAVLGLLAQRSWTSIGALIDKCIADGITQARQTPADSFGVPALLSTAFALNIMLDTINMAVGKTSTGKAGQLLQADLANGLQTALPLLRYRESAGDLRRGAADLRGARLHDSCRSWQRVTRPDRRPPADN